MAIKLISSKYCAFTDDYTCEYICDSDADFANLPKSGVGSNALSPSGAIYMVNTNGEWVQFGK